MQFSKIFNEAPEFLRLLLGTVIFRPYVYIFFAIFLAFAIFQMGWLRTLFFLVATWLIAFAAEYSSTRNGFPFGYYYYIDTTRTRELWVSNIPFWDSLSFVFLSYFSFMVAAIVLRKGLNTTTSPWKSLFQSSTPFLGGFLMMLLDIVIDPVALQGGKWFLGEVYGYPFRGFYFGVTIANFLGWFFVGWFTQIFFQAFLFITRAQKNKWRTLPRWFDQAIIAMYAGIFIFNFAITIYVQDFALARASALVIAATFLGIVAALSRKKSATSDVQYAVASQG